MRALTPWRPSGLSTLHHELDNWFERFFGPEERWMRPFETGMMPAVESFVRNGEIVVRADLPGIDPKDVELSVENNQLTIRGERKVEHKEGEGTEHVYREVQHGRFERILMLPPGVEAESIKATYRNGVLEVTMKAPKEMTSKKVPITVH